MPVLLLNRLTHDLLESVVELDQRSLGGMWSFDAYQREFNSPNSDLLVLSISSTPDSSDSPGATPVSPLVGIGCLWSILEEAHITVLAIHPDYWHQGFGQALLYGLLACACHRKLEWATLEVRRSNQPALALYQKFGFREVGFRKRYYKDTDEDALIFWLSGLHKPEFTESLGQWEIRVRDRLAQSGWSLSVHL
ncbi:ribosomal protein S18-alanine N-acetyltransferase [Oscillatoria acuminata]|uniref:(SSU ribosomal protein S18P)-alanine acetyltransferase n=1 Tax=Oscillatoria acuminata PCC 6304 TaxID=56110 RepID=K9TPV1_9CYAN|nr:ribosomal protein S18-alanine N-acetyltransferase [Oscillatoria acuminata]AFY84585.1 (SSU ribosomal protein S18P)-alanine acetyltransferase [Oscillatoria acuminata PCC 6304]